MQFGSNKSEKFGLTQFGQYKTVKFGLTQFSVIWLFQFSVICFLLLIGNIALCFCADSVQKRERIIERDVPRIKSDVDRQLQQCRKACPSDCDSCGAKKIEELQLKLTEYKANVDELEEDESKESVRNDLMQYL